MDDPPDAPFPSEPPPGPPTAGAGTVPGPEGPPAGCGPRRGGAPDRWLLRRSVRDRKLKGVAGGVAAAADVDPTLIRLLFAAAAFSGWGIVAYIVLAVVLRDETVDHPARPLARDQRRILRIGLLVAAAVAVGRLFDGWFFTGGNIGLPFVLIAVGAAVLWARRDPVAPEPVDAPDPSGGDLGPSEWPVGSPTAPLGAGIDWRSTGHDLLRLAGAFVAVGALIALLGVGFLVTVGAVPMRLPFLPAAVAVLGLLGLVVAVVRRARPLSLFVSGGLLVAAMALAVGLASFPGGAGNRAVVIGPETPLRDRYEHGAGSLELDLGALALPAGSRRRVVAKVGAGQLRLIVPAGLTTNVEAHVGAGATMLFGREQNGAGVQVSGGHVGRSDLGRLDLDLDVGVGQLSVELAPLPTFETRCQVPTDAKGDGTDSVTCPHPVPLAARAMSCSVALVDPENGQTGQAFCREGGSAVPRLGQLAASCRVPADTDAAICDPLTQQQRSDLDSFRSPQGAGPAPTAAPAPPAVPASPAPPGVEGAPLACGPADAAGVRTCTTPASSTSTTAAVTYRCTEDPATRRLSCVPA